ncbi:exocyst complex component 1 [Vanessa atalanta]|uniref:exocyst complex component 1 n=1 Tax=Vanessa atalanta TaxID=42275 RepID=UPI001FCCEBE1|nr:exocyst complex component 1 [Vanessa atalanta]
MKLEETSGFGESAITAEVFNASGRQQRLSAEGGSLTLSEGNARLRSWPLHVVRVKTDTSGAVSIEAGGETLTWSCTDERSRIALAQMSQAAHSAPVGPPSDAALAALLEDAEPDDTDAERRVKRLGERLARLDALNVGGMLAAATEGGGAQLATRLEAGSAAGAALSARLSRLEALTRAAPAALHARSGAARADAAARALLVELHEIYEWLDAPALRDLDSLSEISLASTEGRARALSAAEALRNALRGERTATPARLRLGAVRERLRRLERARDALAAALARHLNNALIHLANEAHAPAAPRRRHHADLQPYAPFMRWLKDMDEKAHDGLVKVYVGTWSRVYEREVHAACESARAALAHAPAERIDDLLDEVLTLVETVCNAEQDFCTQFFHLDVDVKGEAGDGERSEKSDGGERAEGRRAAGEARRLRGDLFPALEQELVALVAHVERHEPYGAMRALACVGRRVLGEGGEGGAGGEGGEARWARAALAAVAVAAKRGADRAVADRLAALPDAVKQAARKPKCGILSFIPELEEMSAVCEEIFARGRRADLDRWYLSLATAMLRAIQQAEHPRTPRAVVQLENYHRLHACVSALRVPALDALRRDAKARYADALRHYVTQYFGRPLEKLAQFFEGVGEAVAAGVREDEVCYRAAFSKHELRRLLALYPAHEVRKSLHRLYRTVEKHLSEEGGLLQVVWRAMQEEFIAQHVALQARIAACYPGAGLTLPLSTQDILDAFSDIAREH